LNENEKRGNANDSFAGGFHPGPIINANVRVGDPEGRSDRWGPNHERGLLDDIYRPEAATEKEEIQGLIYLEKVNPNGMHLVIKARSDPWPPGP